MKIFMILFKIIWKWIGYSLLFFYFLFILTPIILGLVGFLIITPPFNVILILLFFATETSGEELAKIFNKFVVFIATPLDWIDKIFWLNFGKK